MNFIDSNLEPVFVTEDPAVVFYPIKAECEYYSPDDYNMKLPPEFINNWNSFLKNPSEKDKTIRVYDLKDFFGNEEILNKCPAAYLHFATEKISLRKYGDALFMLKKCLRITSDTQMKNMVKIHIALCHLYMSRKEWAKKTLNEMLTEENLFFQFRDKCIELLKQCEVEEKPEDTAK